MTVPDSGEWIHLDGLRVGIQQTLRVPDTGGPYPLPPGLGRIPVRRSQELGLKDEAAGSSPDLFVIGLYPSEAIWLQFHAPSTTQRAVKIGVGDRNAITGGRWDLELHADPQDYIVCPYQAWLDGFHTSPEVVRQFVAVPLGDGATVEEQLTGSASGIVTLACYRPSRPLSGPANRAKAATRRLGLGGGGEIRQRIYPDPYGRAAWEDAPAAAIQLRLMDAREWSRLSGEPLRRPTIDTSTYLRYGLPWFEVYDVARGDLTPTREMSTLRPVPSPPTDAAGDERPPPQVTAIPPRSRRGPRRD
jgi:hypothetical protein